MAFNINENATPAVGIGGLETQLTRFPSMDDGRFRLPKDLSRPAKISADILLPQKSIGTYSGDLLSANNPLMEVLNPVGEYLKQQASNQIEPEVNTFLQQVMQLAQQRFPNLGGTNLQGIGSLMPVPQLPTTFSPFSIAQFDRPINAARSLLGN
jgi:hypothetical protein